MKRALLMMMAMTMASCASAPGVLSPAETPAEVAAAKSASPSAAHPDNKPGEDFDELWGEKVPDPYRWLEDPAKDDVQAWMKAQDSLARDYIGKLPGREGFAQKLSELLYVPSVSAPIVRGDMAFYFARGAKDEKSIVYVRSISRPQDEPVVVLDPNTFSEDGSISLGEIFPSPSGRYVAYTTKKNNADKAEVRIYDMHDGRTIDDVIEGGRYADPEWDEDSSGFYYTWFPTDESIPVDERPGRTEIRHHVVGTDGSKDVTVIGALNDPTKFHYVQISDDAKWLAYSIQDGWNGNSLRFAKAAANISQWVDVPTKPETAYQPRFTKDAVYILTNDGAPKNRILKIDIASLDAGQPLPMDKWTEIVPESEAMIEDFAVINGKLFVTTLKDVVSYLDVYDLDGKHLKSVDLPDRGAMGRLYGRETGSHVYFKFASFKLPASVYQLDADALELSVWAKIDTPAKTDDVISEQFFATSKDGTKIPYFVLRHKNTPVDGTAKMIITGYGGFTYAMTPSFSPTVYAWLEAGGMYVYSNLRGGSEYGEAWHQAGMKLKKQNVFDDFYAVAEDMIAKKYTRPASLAVYGGSNGGLLTGAALTQRPDLYGAVVCAVPLLDMIRYHKFGSGRTWIGEYGNAENSLEEFKAIRAYSPYANVKSTAYPSVLFLGADSDDRVDPMHARKMTAAIQDATTSDKPVFLRIEKNSGHGGADLTHQRIAQFADIYAFLWEVLE